MMGLNDTPVDTEAYGSTKRQQMLTRAAEYYVLHRYGYPVASLWLSKFLNSSVFCKCENPDCAGRHFGFIDAEASYSLVLKNIDYINGFVKEVDSVPVAPDVSMDEIAGDNNPFAL